MARKRRFYKANLATVIWDKEKDKALVEFVKGEFVTSDEKIIKILIAEGYPEVDLDATDPPDFQAKRGKSVEGDIKVMPPKYDEGAALNKQLALAALKRSKESALKARSKRKVKRRR